MTRPSCSGVTATTFLNQKSLDIDRPAGLVWSSMHLGRVALNSSIVRRGLLLLAILCSAKTFPMHAQQFRAAWADVFHVGMGSQSEVNTMVSSLVAGRYNVVIVQVLGYMDNNGANSHGAHWKSSILPWSPRVTASFDPLAYLCTQAHANGIQVHAWLGGSGGGPYRVSTAWPPGGNSTLSAHPEWFMVPSANSEGNAITTLDGNYNLDMGSSDAQDYIIGIVRELVTNYPIDGINWDDEINGAGYTQGYGYPCYSQASYSRSGLARYRINTGFVGTPSNTDTAWSNYRRRFKNELMARAQAEIQSIKTNPRQPLWHTTAPLCYGLTPPSTCDFTSTTAYLYFSDWASMLQNGWVDAAVPQIYRTWTTQSNSFTAWCDRSYTCWQYQRKIFPGLGAYLNPKADVVTELQYAFYGQSGGTGFNGTATYSYAVPSNDGGDWWGYAATNIYTNTTTVPTMPWRNSATATNGMMWGRVSDANTGLYVDDATVTVTGGPTVKTDANGYYIATLISATATGTVHSTTASKSGMTSQTIANATVLAGDIVRYDFTLNAPLPAPSGLTATALSSSRIALAWVNNATNATGNVVSRSGGSGGPYTDIASLAASSTAYTNSGLSSSTTYYYVVRATNSSRSSPNSGEANATTQAASTPPVITSQPQGLTVNQGANATFSVSASGAPPLYYQWRFNATNLLAGTTNSSYTRSNAQPADAGAYSVIVSNSLGSTNSSDAILTVIVPPTIIAQPQSRTTNQGANVTFTVSASGTTPLGYQWRFNAANISGATTSSYTRTNVQLADAGNYSVVVSNSAGTATSSNAVLTVQAPPAIVSQPQSQTVAQGNTVVMTVSATGSSPLFYQWRFYGANLAGATTTALSLSNVTTNQSGPYSAVVTNAYGAATSQVATLTVTPSFQFGGLTQLWSLAPYSRPYLTTNSLPNERGLAYNSVLRHLLLVSRNGPHVYVLDADSSADLNELSVSGISGGTYALLLVGVADDGVVYAGNLTTTGTTTSFRLYRWADDSASTIPTIAYNGDPGGGNNQRWGDTLDVRGAGTNTQVILGSRSANILAVLTTTDGLNFTAHTITIADAPAGAFGLGIAFGPGNTFWGKATGQALRQCSFDLTSGTGASTRIYADPSIPNNVAPIGVNTSLNLLGGINVGASNNHFRLYDLTTNSSTPVLLATNGFPTDYDNSGTGTGALDFGNDRVYALCANNGIIAMQIPSLSTPPSIVTPPQNVTVVAGQDAAFSVTATGTAPLAYQWRFYGTNLAGATASTYTRSNAQPNHAGPYSVLVTNSAGAVTSSVATLTVNVPPSITNQPQSQTVFAGGSATFSIGASGTTPLSYQWRFNGTNLSGATNSSFTRSNAQSSDAGNYSVVVSNVAGSATSSNAALTVLPVNVAPSITSQPQSVTTNQGADVTFTVSATGTPSPTYQWRFNGTNVPGATATAYTRANVQPSDAGDYSVFVSNIAGSVTSSNAVLTVLVPPPTNVEIDSITLLPDPALGIMPLTAPPISSIGSS
ncbi:MAG: hypothetical protein DME25_04245 [Verrucomicrobia bacterium]|nr:MAG: hypothetical protein DME25_04245 [Verrucomicrobiota bacterium]